jgi:transmembrane sensor
MGMTGLAKIMHGEALDWLVRINDPAFDEWDAWNAWMAADPDHAEAYWRLAETEAEAVEALKAVPRRAMSPARPWRSPAVPRRAAIAAGMAAVLVGGVFLTWSALPQPWAIETAPGEQRTIALSDGSQVSLDGGTRLTLDRRKPRDVRLDAGRALFEVVHDDARPFVVAVGEATLTDLGTTFDVTRLSQGARVAVSEGSVRVDAGQQSAVLSPGDSVVATGEGLRRGNTPVEAVSGWRQGRLTYVDEALPVIAEDLARVLNRPVTVAPVLAERRFSGSVSVAATPEVLKGRLELLLGVSIIDEGAGWRLEPRRAP